MAGDKRFMYSRQPSPWIRDTRPMLRWGFLLWPHQTLKVFRLLSPVSCHLITRRETNQGVSHSEPEVTYTDLSPDMSWVQTPRRDEGTCLCCQGTLNIEWQDLCDQLVKYCPPFGDKLDATTRLYNVHISR